MTDTNIAKAMADNQEKTNPDTNQENTERESNEPEYKYGTEKPTSAVK